MNTNFNKRIAACALALLFALSLIPVSLFAARAETVTPYWTVPSGYNAHDYNALASFLEQTNASGKKNGEWLSASYNVNDPTSWGTHHFTFTTGSNKRIAQIDISNHNGIVGSLDLSDCTSLTSCSIYTNKITALNVSGCTALVTLYCYDNKLTSIDVSTNTALGYFSCARNLISSIDVSHNRSLIIFNCSYNPLSAVDVSVNTSLTVLGVSGTGITELDVSHNTQLKDLYCKDNPLTELDLSHNSQLYLNHIGLTGDGTIGTELIATGNTNCVYAVPAEGAEFLGWYNQSGTRLSTEAAYTFYSGTPTTLIAHFTEAVPPALMGDVDFDGDVDITDALLTMRCAMGIITFTAEQIAVGDMDGSGAVNVTDAVMILRAAMGIG
ncbi:MAG: hypothetical protein IK064_06845 [Clostridia bacterium]|nr:hypothetical protein [Clostridia bacterium]